jgi:N-acetylglucosaminyldiphosphoundecaprenol N-acetyl-beta-D-mannosaminyltransferase
MHAAAYAGGTCRSAFPAQTGISLVRQHARDFLGIPIDLVEAGYPLEQILSWRRTGHRGYVSLVNPHSLMTCARDSGMRAALLGSDVSLADGVGITVGARLLGYGRTGRLAGPSLMLDMCDRGRQHLLRHFFYGGGEDVARTLAARLAARFPGLKVCGWFCPPFHAFRAEEDAAIVDQINVASPDIVWVALGTGKQEKWMAAYRGRIEATALIGVGAAFDFHAGTIPWAPSLIRRAGLEWAYRLLQEPGRLWRRNLDGPLFLARIMSQRIAWTLRGKEVAKVER